MNPILSALEQGVTVHDLAQPMSNGMAKAPAHPEFRLTQGRRHGDTVRIDGTSGSSEVVSTGGHVGTHLDALGHISHEGKLYGGVDAVEAQRTGRLKVLGIDEFPPTFCRGVLLDVPGSQGRDILDAAYGITVEDLALAVRHAGVEIREGDAVFVRTGWARNFGDPVAFLGHHTGVPGLTEEAARWIADRRPVITGADTIHYEQMHPEVGAIRLPVHRLLLVERGINILEIANFEGIAARGLHEFGTLIAPLNWVGATGSPVRLVAVA
jgi:kynurenine formamidase